MRNLMTSRAHLPLLWCYAPLLAILNICCGPSVDVSPAPWTGPFFRAMYEFTLKQEKVRKNGFFLARKGNWTRGKKISFNAFEFILLGVKINKIKWQDVGKESSEFGGNWWWFYYVFIHGRTMESLGLICNLAVFK